MINGLKAFYICVMISVFIGKLEGKFYGKDKKKESLDLFGPSWDLAVATY